MRTTKACGLVWFALSLGMAAGTCTAKNDKGSPVRVKISVFNDAGIDAAKVLKAEGEAQEVFERAHIQVEWLNCGRPQESADERKTCSAMTFPTHLHVRIVARSESLARSVVGISYLDVGGRGYQADIFYAGVQEVEARGGVDGGILGMVMVHEIGHLLLGTNSHSETGIMRPKWNRAEMIARNEGLAGFTEAQSERMRLTLANSRGDEPQ